MPKQTRRSFVGMSGTALLSLALPFRKLAHASVASSQDTRRAVERAAERLIGQHARHIRFAYSPDSAEQFQVSGSRGGAQGKILIEGSSASALMMGLNWYLKYVAGVSVSWNGDCINQLPDMLPAPAATIQRQANGSHRFALNDTNDGYTGPYWTWEQWEHLIDVLALHGINEMLVYAGAEAVYQQTFRRFHYSDQELRAWFPTPAHQPWWLLENISSWVGPSVSQHLIDSRLDLAAKITARLRELGMRPVLPGYYGMVPDHFAEKNPGARVVPQGDWAGMRRPDWLDPTCDAFSEVAQEFYRVQQRLLGPATMFKMDPLHEGGQAGGVNLAQAAGSIEAQLQKAHPGATWAILGWQKNPRHEVLAGIKDKSHVVILDGQSDRFAYKDRDTEWNRTPYTFGTIWNFGGHTTIGANMGVWNERYFNQLAKSGSSMNGIAVMPEASCNNPAAFAFFTEMAWRQKRPDLQQWFAQWAGYRYGGKDENAQQAWDVVRATAYSEPSGTWSESHDNLFSAQPSLDAKSACSWSPKEPRYDLAAFRGAIGYLLKVGPSLRSSAAYRYDLVDIARQTIANQSRMLLPQIKSAYVGRDTVKFNELTRQWLDHINTLNRLVGTSSDFLLGKWVAEARAAAVGSAEQSQLEFDALSLLAEWGPAGSRDTGIHDYANREWNGMLEFYHHRWALYFSSLAESLKTQAPAKEIDWFQVDQNWAKQAHQYATQPAGDAYEIVSACKCL